VTVLDIEAARTEARRLAVVVRSDGDAPRELERQQEASKVAAVTVGEIWGNNRDPARVLFS
jgi:hypothetical protein